MPDENDHWLVRPSTIRLLWIVGIFVLALTVAGDLVFPPHGEFGFDGTVGFYALYGFASCVVLVFGSRLIGLVLKRPDDFYDD